MGSVLSQIESEEVIIYTDYAYSSSISAKCKDIFNTLVNKGEIKAKYDDDKWMAYSGVKHFGINFQINDEKYKSHCGKEFGISKATMIDMLKCYTISCNGMYIYQTIAKEKIKVIKRFLEEYTDKNYKIKHEELTTIEDFLGFINTPEKQIEEVANNIRLVETANKTQRKLSPVINYMAIENEINYLYHTELSIDVFKKWFPLFFWVNITFILPLRATEMLLTPCDCIERKNGKVYLKVRRTTLKKGSRSVYYDVEKDYKIFTYEIPDIWVVSIIEKYKKLTEAQERRFLFEYNEFMVNDMLSLAAFNNLIVAFMDGHIIGNKKYDFVRYATGIKEFEYVTAGDSRPIAMTNLYFQKSGEDIVRQLADHTNINTSLGYYTNISETIHNSSIMQYFKKMGSLEKSESDAYATSINNSIQLDHSVCTAPGREYDYDNLDDCIREGHLADCMGCRYYLPSQKEIDTFLSTQKEKADESAKRVIEFMNDTSKLKDKEISLEELFLKVQTDATRYRMGCDEKAKEIYEGWQKHKNSQKTCY